MIKKSMIKKAVKKPVEVEYITYEDMCEAFKEEKVAPFYEEKNGNMCFGVALTYKGQAILGKQRTSQMAEGGGLYFSIPTLEGEMIMTKDDVLIIGVKGEIYPCKKDIFEMTYDYKKQYEKDKE